MKIAIIGSGAVGGYFGARLVASGHEVSFLARGAHLDAIRSHGLHIKSILGDFRVTIENAVDSIPEMGEADLIIVAVKAWQIKEIRDQLNSIINEKSVILPLQNGVLAAEELMEAIDERKVIGGVCRIISKVEAPGVINHFGATPSIVFGELNNQSSRITDLVKGTFDQAGIHCRVAVDIKAEIWRKFGFICAGGLMAVTHSSLGELRELKETRKLLLELITEIIELAKALDIDMGNDFMDRTLTFIDSLPNDTTFSLARDIWDGRPSELHYLNGTVVALGEKYQLKTPINRFIYHVLITLESKARTA